MAALAGGVVAKKAMKRDSNQSAEPVLPDEEDLRRQKRRQAAMRYGKGGTGRASTMMSSNG